MRYGVSFGAPDIPAEVKRGVRERRRKGIQCYKGTVAVLVGACDTAEDKQSMTTQATNGRRGLFWDTKRGWHFVYAYIPC